MGYLISKIVIVICLLNINFQLLAIDMPKPLNNYNVKCYGTADGLPQDSITDIALLPDGQLLVSSYAGLVIFDGNRFSDTIPNSDNYFPHVESFNIDVNKQGFIWIGTTTTGAYGLFENQIHHYDMENGLDSNFVFDVLALDNGALIVTDGSIFLVNPLSENPVQKIDMTQFDENRKKFFKGDSGELLYASDNGIWFYENNKWQSKYFFKNGLKISSNSVIGLKSDMVLLAQLDKVVQVGSDEIKYMVPGFIDNLDMDVTKMLVDYEQSIWMTTNQYGLMRYSRRGLERIDSFPSNRLASIVEDVDGVIWVATTSGLCYVKHEAFKSYGEKQGLDNEFIEYIAIDEEDIIYALPYPPFYDMYTIEKNQTTIVDMFLEKTQKGNRINVITTDDKEQVWAASQNKIGLLNQGVFEPSINIQTRIRGFVVENDTFWYENGEYLIKNKNNKELKIPLNTNNDIVIVSISQALNGDILVAEKSGAYRVVNDVAHSFDIPLKASACMREFNADELWVCSKGLWLKNNNKNHYFGYEHGLTDGQVHEVINDNLGNIWAATNAGLFRILRNDIDAIISGQKIGKVFERFSEKDGIKSSEFNGSGNGAVKTKDGRLWFAGQGGVTVVDPELALFQSDKKLKPFVEHLLIDNHSILPSQWKNIAPNPQTINMSFGAVFLSDAKNLTFRYKFLPYQKKWKTGQSANFPQLQPGKYQLNVQVKYYQNSWSDSMLKEMHVMPAWYQTWWFKIVASLILILIIFGLPLWRIQRLNKKSEELEALVENRTVLLTKANEKLFQQSRLDVLTGIANRREFIDQIGKLIKENPPHICLALIDIDDFKAYNDHYGHIAGDECLKKVSKILDDIPSKHCSVARFGGEEFVLLFDSLQIQEAASLITDMCNELENIAIPHINSSVENVISLSIGLVENKKGERVESLINRSDIAMYQAKANGKNKLVVN